MRNTFLKTIGGLALAISLVATPATQKALSAQSGRAMPQRMVDDDDLTRQKASAAHSGVGRLVGTWDVQLTIRNCQTGAALRTFPELTTFMFGGTMLDSTSGIPQALKTPGQGVWVHISGNTYRFSFKSLNFEPGGAFTGSTKVIHEATLNSTATEYSSVGTAEVYNPNGDLILTGCSTTTATRFRT
jgi:hypothetical protein